MAENQPLEQPEPSVSNYSIDELTKLKLLAEIGNLKKPLYKRIEFYSFITTTLIASITAFVLYKNGAFDFKTKQLTIEKANLEFDIRHFKEDTTGYAVTRTQLLLRLRHDTLLYKNALLEITKRYQSDTTGYSQAKKDLNNTVREYLLYRKETLTEQLNLLNKEMESLPKNKNYKLSSSLDTTDYPLEPRAKPH